MKKPTYFDQVRAYQNDHPSLTWKECCNDVSLIIKSAKIDPEKQPGGNKSKFTIRSTEGLNIDEEMVACPACGYSVPEPGNAWVCLACGHQN